MWEEEHPPIGFRNSNESIIFAQFLALGIGSAWIMGGEHTMAITMLTALGALSLILYFNHAQQGLFEHRRSARRFWLLLLPVLYAVAVFTVGLLYPTLETVQLGLQSFKVVQQQPAFVPVSTLPSLGWPMLAYGSGVFIATIGLLMLTKGPYLFWRLLWVLALSACALAAFGWLVWLLGAQKLYFFVTPPQEEFFSTFTHPRYWSTFALAWSAIMSGLLLQKKAQRDWADFLADKGLLLLIAFALLFSSAVLTGAPIHHAAGGLLIAYFCLQIAMEQWQKKARKSSLLFWFLCLVLAIGSIGYLLQSTLGNPDTAAPTGMLLTEQKLLWTDAWQLFRARPLFGWGEGGFAALHPFLQSTDLPSLRYANPASGLLLSLSEKGLLGTMVAWLVPVGVVIAFFRLPERKDLSYCLLLCGVMLVLFASVTNALQSPPILLTFYLVIVSAYQWSRLNTPEKTPVSKRLIAPEPQMRTTANSRRQQTLVKLPTKSQKSAPTTVALRVAGNAAVSTSPSEAPPAPAADTATGSQPASQPVINSDAHYDFIVIGGGSAGYAAANLVQRAGRKVAIIDEAKELGGLCILRGCMPSKTLIYSTEVLHLAKSGALFGLDIPSASVDMPALHERKKRTIAEFAEYRQEQLQSGRWSLYRSKAKFTAPRVLELADGTVLSAEKILIATGSTVSVPPIPGLSTTPFWTSDDILELDAVPESVIVLGGGIVACELAQFLRRIGSKVTIIQRSARLLKEQSPEASAIIGQVFADEGIEVITDTQLEQIESLPDGGVHVRFKHKGGSHSRTARHLFNALGRKPNTGALQLEAAGVRLEDSGHIAVNAFQQTANPDIYAAGDVAGPHEIVHVAIMQAGVAARHALQQKTQPVDTSALTGVVFTDPQIARVGPSDAELERRGIATVSADYPFDDHGKSILMEAKYGYVKTVVNKANGRLVAAECVGKDASELIHALAVAVSLRAQAADLLGVHWYHPTLSEIWTYPLEDCVDALKETQP